MTNGYTLEEFEDDRTVFVVPLGEANTAVKFEETPSFGRLAMHLECKAALTTPHVMFALAIFTERLSMSSSFVYGTSFIPGTW